MVVKEYVLESNTVGRITFITVTLILPTVYEKEGYLTVSLPSTVSINPSYFRCEYFIGFTSDSSND